MKLLSTLALSFLSLNIMGQSFFTSDNKKYLIDWKVKINSDCPECFNENIPVEIRFNQEDTIYYKEGSNEKYKLYKFYKGKCDTVCFLDTVEMYFEPHYFYFPDSISNIHMAADISEAMKKMNEQNLSSIVNNSTNIWRFTCFYEKFPYTLNIKEFENKKVIIKRTFNGFYLYPERESTKDTIELTPHIWHKLTELTTKISQYKPTKEIETPGGEFVFESLVNGSYNSIYLPESESNLPKILKRRIKKFEEIIKTY